jgi:hypothetical protein
VAPEKLSAVRSNPYFQGLLFSGVNANFPGLRPTKENAALRRRSCSEESL